MARPLRIEHTGGWYHVTARGNERRDIFRDDSDRTHFLELLGRMAGQFPLKLHTYVLMGNHYHLIIELREPCLSRALQWLNVSYSVWFNRRHGRSGHLFQGRFKSILFSAPASALEVSRYVHLNPVRVKRLGLDKAARAARKAGAGAPSEKRRIQERLNRLRNYRWSSYRAYIGSGPCPPWLTRQEVVAVGRGSLKERRERYRQYVEEPLREGQETDAFWAELKEGAVLGSERFVQEVREWVKGDGQEQRGGRRLKQDRLDWTVLVQAQEKLKGERWEQFKDAHGDAGRDMLLYVGRRRCGMKLKDLAAACGLASYGAAAMAIQRYERKLARYPEEAKNAAKLIEMLNVKM